MVGNKFFLWLLAQENYVFGVPTTTKINKTDTEQKNR